MSSLELKLKRNPDVEAAVVEEFYKDGAYVVIFRAVRQDTQKVIQRRL